MNEFDPKNLGQDIDPETGNFIKKNPEASQQPIGPETESSIDFGLVERSLADGTADEYREYVGAVPVEGLLEEQGDERTVDQLSPQERSQTTALFSDYAAQRGLRLETDEKSCIAWAA